MQRSAECPREVWAIVPVKRLSRAKQRLAPVLSRDERARLVCAMLQDVLTTLHAVPNLGGILVVSGDPIAAKLAKEFDARIVDDILEAGVNAAVGQGLYALGVPSAGALIVPADVPFATIGDIEAVLGELGRNPIVLAPALSDGGTNALAMRRADLLAPSFGEDSFARHQALARDEGVGCGIVRTYGLGRDIDCPGDLVPWGGSKTSSLTSTWLAEFKLTQGLGAAALRVSEGQMPYEH
jgi:2-phospho-L-lactate/phosphoenolpyruvate guanylyltransferase